MLNAAMEQKATDGLNFRLSVACNTAVPFMLFGIILGQVAADSMVAMLWSFVGFGGYSLAEYAFHRWVLHHLVMEGHRLHHTEPLAPHAMPFSTGLCAHTLMLVVLSLSLGLDVALYLTLGTSIGYALFCQLHELIHRDPNLARRLVPRLYRHHMLHHHAGTASPSDDSNYGVLTTIWDRLFGTYRA